MSVTQVYYILLVYEEYDITVASFGLGTGKQTRIESDCGNF